MKNKSVALTDMVKKLGYENSGKLSNQIRDIFKLKEDFKKKYVVEEKNGSIGRPEKFLVSEDAEILIDNIAIIQQYSMLFGKAPVGESLVLPYYRELKQGIDKKDFQKKFHAQMEKLEESINRSKRCLESLPTFAKIVLNNPKLDICNKSIRKYIESNTDTGKLINLGKTYELAAWNELIELQNKVVEGENTSLNHQLIGDRFLSLGDIEQALTAFEQSVELDPNNGVAWALMALATYKELTNQYKELHTALARSDFTGFIENPIDAEEYWINERVEETSNDASNSRKRFVDAAIQGLQHWPEWDNVPRTLSDGTKKPNYHYHLNQSRNTSVELTRDKLFLLLLRHIEHEDFIQRSDVCVEILRSFQHWNPQINPLTNIMFMPLEACGLLIQLISWIDKDEVGVALRELVKNIEHNAYSANKVIQFFKDPFISQMFWEYLGREKYTDLFVLLEKKEHEKLKKSRIKLLAELQIKDVLSCFTDLLIQLKKESLDHWLRPNEDMPKWSLEAMKQLEVSCHRSLKFIDGWESFIDGVSFSRNDLPESGQVLIFLASLVEISNGLRIDANTETLMSFAYDKQSFSSVRHCINEHLLSLFLEWILGTSKFEGTKLRETVLTLVNLDGELAMEEDDFFF